MNKWTLSYPSHNKKWADGIRYRGWTVLHLIVGTERNVTYAKLIVNKLNKAKIDVPHPKLAQQAAKEVKETLRKARKV